MGGGEDTEESVSEEKAATVMGAGEARRKMTATAEGSEENGADGKHRGAAAGGGDTGDATSTAADEAEAGGLHGARTAARERVADRRENPAGEPYGVGGGGEGTEIPPPPEQLQTAEPTAATTAWRAGQGRRRCRAQAARQ